MRSSLASSGCFSPDARSLDERCPLTISRASWNVFARITAMRPCTSPEPSSVCSTLREFPKLGRNGLADNTRELVFPKWPYIVVYEILEDQVNVPRMRPAAQDWP